MKTDQKRFDHVLFKIKSKAGGFPRLPALRDRDVIKANDNTETQQNDGLAGLDVIDEGPGEEENDKEQMDANRLGDYPLDPGNEDFEEEHGEPVRSFSYFSISFPVVRLPTCAVEILRIFSIQISMEAKIH